METMAWNVELFRLVNGAHNSLGDAFFGTVSGLGDGLVVALLCSLLMLFRLRLGIAALSAYIISGLLAQLLKRLFDMPRPPAILDQVHLLGHALSSHSFPSGHATSDGVMVLAAFLLWSVREARSWAVALLFLLAAIGRIYGGVHFPLDVMVGLLIGILSMWGCWRLSARLPVERWQQSPWSSKLAGLIVAGEAVALGLGYHMQPATAQPLALILPLAALFILMKVWKEKFGHSGSL